MSDAYRSALDATQIHFASDDALAWLAGTRATIQGSDHVGSALDALQTWPGLPDLESAQAIRDSQPQTSQQQQSSQAGSYDCATDTCSNGRQLSAIGKAFRKLNCMIGGSNAGLCDPPLQPGDTMRSDGTGADSGLSTWAKLLGLDPNDAIKRTGFILFAIILIAIGVYALVGKQTIAAVVE